MRAVGVDEREAMRKRGLGMRTPAMVARRVINVSYCWRCLFVDDAELGFTVKLCKTERTSVM